MERKLVGKVSHFYTKIGVAVVELSGELRIGDRIAIEGPGGSFEQTVSSMQIEKAPISSARAGQSIGLKVEGRTREGDSVFRIS